MIPFDIPAGVLPPAVAVALTLLLAGFFKGVAGLGLPTVAGTAGHIHVTGSGGDLVDRAVAGNQHKQMLTSSALGRLVRRLWSMQLAVVTGTLWAPLSLATLDTKIASAGLGGTLMIHAVLGLGAIQFPFQALRNVGHDRWRA